MQRNCSMAPGQLARVYAGLCMVSLLLALMFALQGAWWVLVFSALELSAVGTAFLYYARHASDRETLMLLDDCLVVELVESERCRRFRFDIGSLQVDLPVARRGLIGLRAHALRLEVGRFVLLQRRRQVVHELRQAMERGR